MGEDSLLERVTAAAERQLSQNSTHRLPAHLAQNNRMGGGRRPRPRNLPSRKGSSMRRRPAAEVPLASPPGQSCARPPLSRSRFTKSLCRVSCAKVRPRENRAALPHLLPTGPTAARTGVPMIVGPRPDDDIAAESLQNIGGRNHGAPQVRRWRRPVGREPIAKDACCANHPPHGAV
jgi:hypothetical protein